MSLTEIKNNLFINNFMKTSKYIPSWVQFGWTPWGFGKDFDDKPSKIEMFNNNFEGN